MRGDFEECGKFALLREIVAWSRGTHGILLKNSLYFQHRRQWAQQQLYTGSSSFLQPHYFTGKFSIETRFYPNNVKLGKIFSAEAKQLPHHHRREHFYRTSMENEQKEVSLVPHPETPFLFEE